MSGDTTRADPETLRRVVFDGLSGLGRRGCASPTGRHANARGLRRSCASRGCRDACGGGRGDRLHGHRDRDSPSSHAGTLDACATRCHGAAIGIGRARRQNADGHAASDLVLMGYIERRPLGALAYCEAVSAATGVPIREYPSWDVDAFRTGTECTAARRHQCLSEGGTWISSMRSTQAFQRQGRTGAEVDVGPMSGRSI